ncbi:hypothetical protein [Telluribacter humicola]|uniref:hypothetical protein n=1 Tax=Telluribacter humicola TaxID=1720261 RepID=UPI001A961DCE|nr:hypothetical protein [Telluribacter humicola]
MSKTFAERVKEVANPNDFLNNSHILDEVRPLDQETVLECLQSGLHSIKASVQMAPLLGAILERLTKVEDIESEENREILWKQYTELIQAAQTKN